MTITGKLTDAVSGESLPFANIYISDSKGVPVIPQVGSSSNMQGQYTLDNISSDEYVSARYLGYATKTFKVKDKCGNSGSCTLNFSLTPEGVTLPEVVVTPEDDPKRDSALGRLGSRRLKKEPNTKKALVYAGTGVAVALLALSLVKIAKK